MFIPTLFKSKSVILSFSQRNVSLSVAKYSQEIINLNNEKFKLGFLGTGRIAQAIILGLIKKNILKPVQIYASDSNYEYLNYLKEKCPNFKNFNINYMKSNSDVLKHAQTVIISVKPKEIVNLLNEISNKVDKSHLVLSIAAGVQLKKIEKCLSKEARVIRIMPNITALIQQSCSVFSRGTNATDVDARLVRELLEAIGSCEDELSEDLMDAVTALSGSGPAYMCVILDALADGGVKMGMSRQLALRLAVKTMAGSANMVLNELDKGKHILQIKEEVCSPGGTSIHGISELENHKIRHAFIKCIEAATIRGKELNSK